MLTFNRDSWHGRLAFKYTLSPGNHKPNNICAYIRHVIRGIWVAAVLTFLVSVVLTEVLVLPLISFITGYGWWFGSDPASIAFQASCTFLVIIPAGFIIWDAIKDKWPRREAKPKFKPHKPPGFLKTAYRSFKEKTCILIELK